MAKRLQYRRVFAMALLLAAAFAGLGYRLVDLQVLRHEVLSAEARKKTQHEFLIEPRRGDILDARGNLLATSVFVKTLCADPTLIGNRQAEVARALAPLIQIPEGDLAKRLGERVRTNEKGETVTNRYVILKHKVPSETWQKIQTVMAGLGQTDSDGVKRTFGVEEKKLNRAEKSFYRDLRLKSIFVDPQDDQLRVYPNQNLAAHVLGYVGMEEKEANGTRIMETAGKDGVEMTFNSKLGGVHGWRLTETDRQGREIVPMREQDVEARDGLNVVLTIDSFIQNILEEALADGMEKHTPISISGMVIRPRTGEILAMATLPNFDPNNPGGFAPEARRNRIISDIAEPGSTFKIVVVSGALNDGTTRLSDSYDCEHGSFYYASRTLHDHERYGVLSVQEIIMKSSNIGAAKIGIKMGEPRLYDYIKNFGFGMRTGIPLPGEIPGIVHPVKNWSKVSIAQIPMGHGIAVTRLQMMMAMCAIANDGWLVQPMLVDRLEDRDHNVVVKYTPHRVRKIISDSTDKLMVKALKTVVSTNGTAPKAALEHFTVAGKTGTAQKVENGAYVHKFFSSFIGFFPADNPELCIAVMMDEPREGYYGGTTAAPIFKQIAERSANYLNIRPEDADGPGIPDTTPPPSESRPVKTASIKP